MSEQPTTAVPERTAPMMVRPVEQKWSVEARMYGAVRIAELTVQSPWATMVFPLTEEHALGLANALRDAFAGQLVIASSLPNKGT